MSNGEMIERVARALCKADGYNPDHDEDDPAGGRLQWMNYAPDARAAIEAMREPTEAMVLAMIGKAPSQTVGCAPFDGQEIFRAAIDEALK